MLADVRMNMASMATIKSYNYRRLCISYGPNREHIVSLGLPPSDFPPEGLVEIAVELSMINNNYA